MRTSLDASTITPGKTAPDASLTTPAIVLCARAAVGSTRAPSAMKIAAAIPLLVMPLPPLGRNRYPPDKSDPTKKGARRTKNAENSDILLTPPGRQSQGLLRLFT